MHADAEEEIIVKVPPGVKSGPRNTGYWRLLKALNGTRKASQSFQDFCAKILTTWWFMRNIHNPAIYYHWDLDLNLEIHGDDFLIDGPREAL